MGRTILQKEIPREQARKLVQTGKTDLLPRFISKKGKPFSAFLVLGDKGKVGFEFEPRAPKKGSAKAGNRTTKSAKDEDSSEPAGV
jgi:DNA topoisomerase-3